MTSFSHSLGLISCALQVANSEHMIAVFSAASWLPQKRKFFLDKVRWSNRILRQIIIDFQISIFQVILHSWPKRISIGNSLSHATSWWYFSISLFHPFFKGVKYGSCLNAGGVHIVPAHRVFGHLLSVQYDIVPVYSLIVS